MKSYISALFYMNLCAVIAFLPFNSNFDDLFSLAIETLGSVFLFSWVAQVLFELFSPMFGYFGILTIFIVVPIAIGAAVKFKSRPVRVLIGVVAMYFSILIFGFMFMNKFNQDMAADNKLQIFECILKSSFTEVLVNSGKYYIQQPHALAIKDGDAYLWSFRSLSFAEKYEEPHPDAVWNCNNYEN